MGDDRAALDALLESTPLSDLVTPRQHITMIEHDTTVGAALQTLAKHNILSAPMVLSPDIEEVLADREANVAPQLLGWLDVADILRALLEHLERGAAPLPARMLALMTELEKAAPAFAARPVVTLRGAEDRSLLLRADGGATSVGAALRGLFLPPGGAPPVHRVALFDPSGEITAVVSQSDVVRWLDARAGALGGWGAASLADLGLTTPGRPVVSVDPHQPTLAALAAMARAGVSGAPVVAPGTGALVANLSVSDLRALTPEHFSVLALPVAEFLALEHGTSYVGYSASASSAAAHPFFARRAGRHARAAGAGAPGDITLHTVGAGEPLRAALARFARARVHRLYVVEGELNRVVAVVSLTDVLRLAAGVW